jgi:hydroxymethylbilane synthase
MSATVVRLGTRGSALAKAQTALVEGELLRLGLRVEVVTVTTSGDLRAPDTAWGEDAFVDALESALRDGRIDAAVHSAKDMPTGRAAAGDLVVAAYLPRADARDALVVRDGDLPISVASIRPGAVVGTDSPRRTGFLLAMRPDLQVRPLSGNVDTRLRKLDDGAADVLILAAAGLQRLGLRARIGAALEPHRVPPAPGQGALALQVRDADDTTRTTLASLDDVATRRAVEAERAVLEILGAGCRTPIGALASVADGQLTLLAGRVEPDGTDRRVSTWTAAATDGSRLAAEAAAMLA